MLRASSFVLSGLFFLLHGRFKVIPLVINPKSVTLSELYGAYDLSTFEWADGILSTLFKQSAESDKPDEKVCNSTAGMGHIFR